MDRHETHRATHAQYLHVGGETGARHRTTHADHLHVGGRPTGPGRATHPHYLFVGGEAASSEPDQDAPNRVAEESGPAEAGR